MIWHSRRVWALLLGSLLCVFSSTSLKTAFTTAQLSLLTRMVLFGFVFRRSRHSSRIYFSTYQQPGYSCAVSGCCRCSALKLRVLCRRKLSYAQIKVGRVLGLPA